jgi:hypothetical protein
MYKVRAKFDIYHKGAVRESHIAEFADAAEMYGTILMNLRLAKVAHVADAQLGEVVVDDDNLLHVDATIIGTGELYTRVVAVREDSPKWDSLKPTDDMPNISSQDMHTILDMVERGSSTKH